MPVSKSKIPDEVLAAFGEPVQSDVPDEVLQAFNVKKKVETSGITGKSSSNGTDVTSLSSSTLQLTPDEVANNIFSWGSKSEKKAPIPANIPRFQKKVSDARSSVYLGTANTKQLTDLYNDANTKVFATEIIKQYSPEATDLNVDNPAIIESAAKNIKEKNRINYVNAEKEGILELDNNAISLISELSQPTTKGGRTSEYISELRQQLSLDDLNNNDKISDAIAKVKEIEKLEQTYYLGDDKKQGKEKTQQILNTLNSRLYYNISKQGLSPTINQFGDDIEQSVLSKVMESERGENLVDGVDKDQIKVHQFKLGLTAVEKSDPVLFSNVIGGIAKLKKVSDTDFNTIARIGQDIDNSIRFRGAAYDPTLIDTETSFDYNTFGQKKATAAAEIGEWMKEKGYKNMKEFPENLIRQAAKEKGVDNVEVVNSLIFDEKLGGYDAIPKSGWIDDIVSGVMQPLVGINSTLNSWSESPAETYLRSRSFEGGLVGGQKVLDKKGELSDILPSEREKFTTDMFRGLGQFIPQVLLTKGVGSGLKVAVPLTGATLSANQARNVADFGGTFISTFLQSYGPAYEEHLQKTGDSNTSALIGTIDGISAASFELLLPDVRIADKALSGLKRGLTTDLVGLIKKGGDPAELMSKARPIVQKFFQGATNTLVQENLEELGTQYVDFVTESIFDPASAKDRNLNKELWDTFKSTTAAMLLPSILGAGGGSFQKDFTTKSLHSAAINIDSYKESLQKTLDNGYISQDDFNNSVKILETHKQSIDNAPDINATGTNLTPEAKLNYALEDTKIKVYKTKAEQAKGVAKEMWDNKIIQAEEVQREILMPKVNPDTAEETVIIPESQDETVVSQTADVDNEGLIQNSVDFAEDIKVAYRQPFLDDPQNGLREISEQLNTEGAEQTTRSIFGDRISDIALQLFPKQQDSVIIEQNPSTNENIQELIQQGTAGITEINEPSQTTETGQPTEKPTIRVTADQLQQAQPQTPFQRFQSQISNDVINVTDSSFDWRIKLPEDISTSQRNKGIADIKAGKDTIASRKVSSGLQDMFDSGEVLLNRGRGNNAEVIGIPIEEYLGAVESAVELEDADIEFLNTELGEEAFGDTFDLLYDNVLNQQNEQQNTGTVGQAEPTTTTTAETTTKSIGSTAEPITVGEEKTTVQRGKEIAAKIRKLKTKRDTLQANIFGIPVAIYDGAIELVATAVEQGAALAQAIQGGIRYIREQGGSELDENGFKKHLQDIEAGEKPKVRVQVGDTTVSEPEPTVTPEQKAKEKRKEVLQSRKALKDIDVYSKSGLDKDQVEEIFTRQKTLTPQVKALIDKIYGKLEQTEGTPQNQQKKEETKVAEGKKIMDEIFSKIKNGQKVPKVFMRLAQSDAADLVSYLKDKYAAYKGVSLDQLEEVADSLIDIFGVDVARNMISSLDMNEQPIAMAKVAMRLLEDGRKEESANVMAKLIQTGTAAGQTVKSFDRVKSIIGSVNDPTFRTEFQKAMYDRMQFERKAAEAEFGLQSEVFREKVSDLERQLHEKTINDNKSFFSKLIDKICGVRKK